MEFVLFRGLILPSLSWRRRDFARKELLQNDIAFITVLRNTDPQNPLLEGINDTVGVVNQVLYGTDQRGSDLALLVNDGLQVRIDLKGSFKPCNKVIKNCFK